MGRLALRQWSKAPGGGRNEGRRKSCHACTVLTRTVRRNKTASFVRQAKVGSFSQLQQQISFSNITLGLDPMTLSSPQRIARLLNVILLPGCFLKTFIDIIDIMFLSLLSYVLTFLFNMYRILFTLFFHV